MYLLIIIAAGTNKHFISETFYSLCEVEAPQFQHPERTKGKVDQSISRKCINCFKDQSDSLLAKVYCSLLFQKPNQRCDKQRIPYLQSCGGEEAS